MARAKEVAAPKVRSLWPRAIGDCVDKLYALRTERLKIDAQAEKLRVQEAALKEHIINTFSKDNINGATGKLASASITNQTVAHVQDWTTFMEYVGREQAYDLVQRRVNDAAYRERLDARVAVPGVEPFAVVKVSVTKRAGRL